MKLFFARIKYSNRVALIDSKGPFLNIATTTTKNYNTQPPSHEPTYHKSILHRVNTQAAQPHYRNTDVTLVCERYCVTNGYLQTLLRHVNAFS